MSKVLTLIAAFVAYMFVLWLAADLLRLFGLPLDLGWPFVLGILTLLAAAIFASQGFRYRFDPVEQMALVFSFIAVWLFVISFPNAIVLLIFFGVVAAV